MANRIFPPQPILCKNLFALIITVLVACPSLYSQTGFTCASAKVINSFPYSDVNQTTCGAGDDYSSISACGSSYLNGDDMVYEYTPSVNCNISINLTSSQGWKGVIVSNGCPDVGTCVSAITASSGDANGTVAVIAGNTYYFTVSTWPSPQCLTTYTLNLTSANCPAPTCNDPSTLNVTGITTSSAILGWTENGSATTWDIELGSGGFIPTGTPTANNVTSNPYTYAGLSPATSYDYYVRADCGGLQSNWIGPFNFLTAACNLQAPSALAASNISSTSADLSWTENGNASIWDIELGLMGFSPTGTPTASNVTNNPYNYTGLLPTTSYDFYVRAKCGASNSVWAGPFNFTTPATPPSYTKYIGRPTTSANWGRAIIYDASDNTHVMAIASRFDGQTAGSYDNLIVKVNQAGDTIWTVAYGTAFDDTPYDIIKTSDGGFIVVGQSNFDDATAIKISSTGVLEWQTFIDESDGNSRANAVVEAANGNFIIAGRGSIANENMYVWELDQTTGALQNSSRGYEYWFTLAVGGNPSEAYDIINTTDGGYALAGKIDSRPAVLKLSSTFTIDWFMIWGTTNDLVMKIIENAADDYTVFVRDNSGLNNNFNVMRFTNPAGTPSVVWENEYDGTGRERIEDAVATTGGYYIAGLGNIMGDPNNDEGYVMKITTGGAYVWDNYIGTDDVESYAIATAPTGAVVAGLSNVSGSQAFYSKVDQNSYSCSAVSGKPAVTTIAIVGTSFITSALGNGRSNGFGTVVTTPALSKSSGFPNSQDCNTTVLPITLAFFEANCNGSNVVFEWLTLSEINNDYFTIERSNDAINFEVIGIIEGAGNSNTQKHYHFVDDSPLSNAAYYRLKQTDYNGKFSYSGIIVANCSNTGITEFTVFPNPANENITISFNSNLKTDFTYEITDCLGRILLSGKLKKGGNLFNIDIENKISTGIYMLGVYSKQKKVNKIIIKK